MSDIFFSYAREDRDKAKALAELCQQQAWSVWWDRRIPPGRSFDEVIEEALGAAKCVVVLWSKSSASSDWVKGEAAEGLRRKILVPVRIDSANVPLEFRRLQTVDLSDWKGEAGHLELGGFLEAVAANIKGVVQRPPSEGSQRKLMKPVLTVLAIVALLAAGFAFYKFAGDRARLGSRASAGGSPAPQPPQTLTPTPVAAKSSPIAPLESSHKIQKGELLSTNRDEPTPLISNEIRGNGVGEDISYYCTFNAGPDTVKVTIDGKNKPGFHASAIGGGGTDVVDVEISDLDAKRLFYIAMGDTTIDQRKVESFQLGRRQQVIMRILLTKFTLDYMVRVEGPDFSPAPKLGVVEQGSEVTPEHAAAPEETHAKANATPTPSPSIAESRRTWSIPRGKEGRQPRPHVVFWGKAGTRYTIWYDEGDGDAVGIDNSNARDPQLHNLIPLAKGTSSEYTIESGDNLGIYLRRGATYAKGHIEERK